MKSIFEDRETVGTMLLNTHDEHMKNDKLEIGEVGEELGKAYMKGIHDNMEENNGIADKYYILVRVKKDPMTQRIIQQEYYSYSFLPPMEHNTDVWFVDFMEQKLEVLWSLPHISQFNEILKNKESFHKDVIRWMLTYKKMYDKANKKKVNELSVS